MTTRNLKITVDTLPAATSFPHTFTNVVNVVGEGVYMTNNKTYPLIVVTATFSGVIQVGSTPYTDKQILVFTKDPNIKNGYELYLTVTAVDDSGIFYSSASTVLTALNAAKYKKVKTRIILENFDTRFSSPTR